MKDHYKIIGVSKNSNNKQITDVAKTRINYIKNLNIPDYDKRKALSILKNSYNFLMDYHSRKQLDEFLETKSLPNFSSIFNMPTFDIKPIEVKNGKSYFYQQSSYTSSKLDKDGNHVIEEKRISNNNGKLDTKHTITTNDKDGNKIIKEIPNKKKYKLDYN